MSVADQRGLRGETSELLALPDQRSRQSSKVVHQPVAFDGKPHATRIYDREQLAISKSYSVPAVVTEYSATTIIPPGTSFRRDAAGNLLIKVG